MKKKLPIWIQTFSKIVEWDYLYIDKTSHIIDLVNRFNYVFLSRPRRFGKSLLLDTIGSLFEWKKEYFQGLYAEENWDWERKFPVIKISFEGNLRAGEEVEKSILSILRYNQKLLGVKCEEEDNYSICFSDLIKKVHEKYNEKVVILVDEYDKAILDNIDQKEVAMEIRELLRWFYSVIKWNDKYIRYAILTGVSKFSKASIFSGLNMLEDISLSPRYGNICGITQEELEENFVEYLEESKEAGVDKDTIKEWYNGYNFLWESVYNPFDLLKFFGNNYVLKNYWFATGTPSFLVKLLQDQRYYLPELSDLVVGEELVDSFDLEKMRFEVVLFQTGYLTIEEMRQSLRWKIEYKLKIPNKEVKMSLFDYIIDYFVDKKDERLQDTLYLSLQEGDVEGFIENIKRLFASIPYNNYVKNTIWEYEWYYASVLYAYLQSLGVEIRGEDVTNKGRADMTVIMWDNIYIIEFKVGKKGENPMKQIEEKKYYEKYIGKGDIYLVGMIFDEEEKNICEYKIQKVEGKM